MKIGEEIEVEEQLTAVNRLVSEGILKVCSLSGEQLAKVIEKVSFYDGKCNLSPEDISVMVYAQDNHCRLLTGDKTLRRDETLDNLHSIYVDQWDWEKVITYDQRNEEYLKETVRSIYEAIKETAQPYVIPSFQSA